MKLVFEGKGGYEFERESAKEKLVIGRSYTVEKVEVGSWKTEIYLTNISGRFNSCLFERDEYLDGLIHGNEELLKLIQCERDEFENLNNSLIVKCAEIGDLKAKNLQLEDRLVKANKAVDKVNQMGFWKRLVYLFKGKI